MPPQSIAANAQPHPRTRGEIDLCLSLAATIYIALHSACPGPQWLDRVAPTLGRQGEAPAVIFVAGANKGFGIISLLNRFGDRRMKPLAWQVALRRYKERRARQALTPASASSCGVCGACREPQPPIARLLASHLELHAFELTQANAAWLIHARKAFGLDRKAHSLVVTRAAVSNASGELLVPVSGAASVVGEESISPLGISLGTSHAASRAEAQSRGPEKIERVRAIALDDYARNARVQHIDFLSIDTEGFDALVLEGAAGLLERGAVTVVEFEYHFTAYWNASQAESRSLEGVVRSLGRWGYTCFFQGNARLADGCVAAITGSCWRAAYEVRSASGGLLGS